MSHNCVRCSVSWAEYSNSGIPEFQILGHSSIALHEKIRLARLPGWLYSELNTDFVCLFFDSRIQKEPLEEFLPNIPLLNLKCFEHECVLWEMQLTDGLVRIFGCIQWKIMLFITKNT